MKIHPTSSYPKQSRPKDPARGCPAPKFELAMASLAVPIRKFFMSFQKVVSKNETSSSASKAYSAVSEVASSAHPAFRGLTFRVISK
jgi:hypothetical protein